MASDCIFCKIISGAIPTPRLFEDPDLICIRDIHPQAPTHFLVIPKKHIIGLDEAFPKGAVGQASLVGKMFEVGTGLARQAGLLPGGFRSVINTGKNGGQSVFHLHLHILGGKSLGMELA